MSKPEPFVQYDFFLKAKAINRTCDAIDMEKLRDRIEWALDGLPGLLIEKPSIEFITKGEIK